MARNVTFKKLVSLFLLTIIPVFGISISIILYNYQQHRQSVYLNLEQSAERTVALVNQDLQQLYQLAGGVALQSNVRKVADRYFQMDGYELASIINGIREQQTSLCNANAYLDNLILYYRHLGKAYNASVNKLASFFEFDLDAWNAKLLSAQNLSGFAWQDGRFSSLIALRAASYLVEAQLATEQIWAALCAPFAANEFCCLMALSDGALLYRDSASVALARACEGDALAGAKARAGGRAYTHISRPLERLNATVHYYFPDDGLFSSYSLIIAILCGFFALVVVAVCVFILASMRLVRGPMNTLMAAFDKINRHDYSVHIDPVASPDFQLLYNSFNTMAGQLNVLIEKNYKSQIAVNKAELRQLQSQINPHFLYNSFFTLRSLISDELSEDALHLCSALGHYYRYITRSDNDSVPLAEEYKHARIYADIQSIRFAGRVRARIEALPEAFAAISVPKLIIQPLIENAFKYAFETILANGELRLGFIAEPPGLWIVVEDNGAGITDEQISAINARLSAEDAEKDVSALFNIQKRLRLFSGGNDRLVISRSSLGGMKAAIWLEGGHSHAEAVDR